MFNDFNRALRFHCERIPIGFASLRVDSGDNNGSGDIINNDNNNNNGMREDGCGVLEDDRLPLNGAGGENPKKVLILMSDTGGGHRASAEAIKATFHEEFGDGYQVVCLIAWLLLFTVYMCFFYVISFLIMSSLAGVCY